MTYWLSGERSLPFVLLVYDQMLFTLAGNTDARGDQISSRAEPLTIESAALGHLEYSHYNCNVASLLKLVYFDQIAGNYIRYK